MPEDPIELVDLLGSARTELARVEHTLEALVNTGPDGFVTWAMALGEAVEARDALLRAPSLPPQGPAAPVACDPESLVQLARQIDRTLITAVDQAPDPADRLALLSAAMYAGRLREALR